MQTFRLVDKTRSISFAFHSIYFHEKFKIKTVDILFFTVQGDRSLSLNEEKWNCITIYINSKQFIVDNIYV